MQKNMLEEGGTFAEKVKSLFQSPGSIPDMRSAYLTSGPADLMAMDAALATKLQDNQKMAMHASDVTAAVLDRDHLATELLVNC